ncbi:MAG: chromosome partitioning protein [Azospira oryzae]|nr:MAG: chromosome partitioning protein [Azospira oryzae]
MTIPFHCDTNHSLKRTMIISIVNHKGGTGKTTTSINLGSSLAEAGYRVVLVDLDAQGSLTYSLGIDDRSPTIADAFHGDATVHQLIIEREGMAILPAGAGLADVELAIAKADERFNHLSTLLQELPDYDFVLIDCPPSLSLLTLNALAASDYIIVPMQMDVLALRGLDSMLETVRKVNAIHPRLTVLGIVPVMVDTRKNMHQEILKYIQSNYTEHVFTQVIHTSVKAAEAPSFGKSVVAYAPQSTTAIDYRALAKEVVRMTKKNQQQRPITIND